MSKNLTVPEACSAARVDALLSGEWQTWSASWWESLDVATRDQLDAAGRESIQLLHEHAQRRGLHQVGTYEDSPRLRAWLALFALTAIAQRGDIQWCEHLRPKSLAHPPATLGTVHLGARVAICEQCFPRYAARGIEDDGLCDFCQQPAKTFTPGWVPTHTGLVVFGDFCPTCFRAIRSAPDTQRIR